MHVVGVSRDMEMNNEHISACHEHQDHGNIAKQQCCLSRRSPVRHTGRPGSRLQYSSINHVVEDISLRNRLEESSDTSFRLDKSGHCLQTAVRSDKQDRSCNNTPSDLQWLKNNSIVEFARKETRFTVNPGERVLLQAFIVAGFHSNMNRSRFLRQKF